MPPKKEDLVCLTKQQTTRLCELYQEESCLWNVSSPDYSNRDKRDESTEKISEQLKNEFDDLRLTGMCRIYQNVLHMHLEITLFHLNTLSINFFTCFTLLLLLPIPCFCKVVLYCSYCRCWCLCFCLSRYV